jgi:S-adenosylmethionine hydrolase
LQRPRRLIAFLTDFGWRDPYVGIVKGVIDRLSRGKVRVIDITHDVPSFSIVAGAYVLYTSYKYFPPGTVFLVVVDPGVGTERRAVAIRTERYFFVGPDNGVLYPAAAEDGILEARIVSNETVFLKPVSRSFHGRDVFAPAATLVAMGVDMAALGPRIEPDELAKLSLREECRAERVRAKVVYVDHFGNVALGLREECVTSLCARGRVEVRVGEKLFSAKCLPVFSLAERGELVFYVNSLGFPELAVNLGDASSLLGVGIGDEVELVTPSS